MVKGVAFTLATELTQSITTAEIDVRKRADKERAFNR
jgi:hypothetical protein